MNRIELIGNLARDPEYKEGANYRNCKFTLAVTSRRKDKDGKPVTEWWDCTAWNGLADTVVKYCKKGNKLYVSGTCDVTKKKNESNGSEQTFINVNVAEVEFLTPKGQNSELKSPLEEDPDDADIPF